MTLQSKAQLNLFLAIIEENGYYENLRHFAKKNKYNMLKMAEMLNDAYDKSSPQGMSIYYFMDSLEDAYPLILNRKLNMNYISDIVDFVYDNQLWKE